MADFNPHDAIDYIYTTAPLYGSAKGKVAELEAYKSSLKSIMMKKSGELANRRTRAGSLRKRRIPKPM